jgi:hypothetical protein
MISAGSLGVQAHGLDSWGRNGVDVHGVLATMAGAVLPHEIDEYTEGEEPRDRYDAADDDCREGIGP